MPETIDKFLKNIDPKNIDKQGYQFLKIFVEGMLNNKELANLLNQNSKDAIQKLLNVMTEQLKYPGSDSSQLKDILTILNTIHNSSTINTNTLRELFLLYIPINYQVFREDGNFSKNFTENEDDIKNSTLSIMFETYSFSNILITLDVDNNNIILDIKTDAGFPFDKFKSIVAESSKEAGINVLYNFTKIKNSQTKGQKQNFKVISDDYVPISVINISYIAIKAIFKIDSDMKDIEA